MLPNTVEPKKHMSLVVKLLLLLRLKCIRAKSYERERERKMTWKGKKFVEKLLMGLEKLERPPVRNS